MNTISSTHRCFGKSAMSTAIALMLGLGAAHAQAATTYFISNTACNDSNPPSDITKPWCHLSTLAGRHFSPGDVIKLAKGSTWMDEFLSFTDVGTATPGGAITITSYQPSGSTSTQLPRITSSKTTAADQANLVALRFANASNWVIQDLDISHVNVGLLFNYSLVNGQLPQAANLQISNIKVHEIYGRVSVGSDAQNWAAYPDGIFYAAGIRFYSDKLTVNQGSSLVQNIVLDNIEGYYNQHSISLDFDNVDGSAKKQGANHVWLNHLYLHTDNAAHASSDCSDSLRLVKVTNANITNSLIDHGAACYAPKGTAAVMAGYTGVMVFSNNIIRNTPLTVDPTGQTPSPDQSAIDFEIDNFQAGLYGNLLSGNRLGMECMMFHFADAPCHFTADGNAIVQNNAAALFIYGTKQYAGYGNAQLPTSSFTNNIVSLPPDSQYVLKEAEKYQFNTPPGGDVTPDNTQSQTYSNAPASYDWLHYLVSTNNWLLPDTQFFYSSARDFSTSMPSPAGFYYWGKSTQTNTWSTLAYDANTAHWTASAGTATQPYIGSFELRPTKQYNLALAWKAPKSGYVAIRGRATMAQIIPNAADGVPHLLRSTQTNQGDGVGLRIYRATGMGDPAPGYLWPQLSNSAYGAIAGGDLSGRSATLDWVQVNAGDYLVFEVTSNPTGAATANEDGDILSWAPMITYIDTATNTQPH
ncbi:MAG: hypothetical protein QM749_10615 [Aquabacterium sp.]